MSARRPSEADRLSAAYNRSIATLTGRDRPLDGKGRIKRFGIGVDVSEEFLRAEPEKARATAHELIREQAAQPFRGPRGGRYEAIGDLFDFRDGQDTDRWMFKQWSFVAFTMARYVRPPRRTN